MEASDSGSSHASCERTNASAAEYVGILVKQLDRNMLLTALIKEKCVSFEQDVERGQKLFADSGSSHASCERTNASADENRGILIKQLDQKMLLAALLEEKCVSLKQDVERGQKLFAVVFEFLIKCKVLKPLNYKNEMNCKNDMRKQREIFDKYMQSMAQTLSREASQDAQLMGVKLKVNHWRQ